MIVRVVLDEVTCLITTLVSACLSLAVLGDEKAGFVFGGPSMSSAFPPPLLRPCPRLGASPWRWDAHDDLRFCVQRHVFNEVVYVQRGWRA
ncbi:hypothetical protein V8C44DRAFT_338020 [Trichoderma aethiopicum]